MRAARLDRAATAELCCKASVPPAWVLQGGKLHQYLVRAPSLHAVDGSRVAYTTSLTGGHWERARPTCGGVSAPLLFVPVASCHTFRPCSTVQAAQQRREHACSITAAIGDSSSSAPCLTWPFAADVTVVDLQSQQLPSAVRLRTEPEALALGPLHLAAVSGSKVCCLQLLILSLLAERAATQPAPRQLGPRVKRSITLAPCRWPSTPCSRATTACCRRQ